MLSNVKKNVFWSSANTPAMNPLNEEHLADMIRMSNLRQILNFSIMMILVQTVNVGIFCMMRRRTSQLTVYLAVIALFLLAMVANILLTERIFCSLKSNKNPALLRCHTYAFTALMAVFCLTMTYFNLRERVTMENYLLFLFYLAACPLLTLRELTVTVTATACAALCLFRINHAPPMVFSHMALFCCASIFLSRSRFHSVTGSLRELYQANEANVCLMDQAFHDPLTRLLNRYGLSKRLEELLPAGIRREIPAAVVMVDIDYFKLFNDTYGHCEGDLCLARVAAALSGSVHQNTDFVCRYGGEEFQILLCGLDYENAMKAANRLRKRVEELQIPAPDSSVSPHVTISLGVASGVITCREDFEHLVRFADQQLYRSKENGKNRVTGCQAVGQTESGHRASPITHEHDFPVSAAEVRTTTGRLPHCSALRVSGR